MKRYTRYIVQLFRVSLAHFVPLQKYIRRLVLKVIKSAASLIDATARKYMGMISPAVVVTFVKVPKWHYMAYNAFPCPF